MPPRSTCVLYSHLPAMGKESDCAFHVSLKLVRDKKPGCCRNTTLVKWLWSFSQYAHVPASCCASRRLGM